MFKISHGETPVYLASAVPDSLDQPYNLRNADAVPGVRARTTTFQNSFYPRTVREWNSLDADLRHAPTVSSFRMKLNKDTKAKPPDWFYIGERKWGVHHARLRMMCSSLNDHLYSQLHVIDDPMCQCGTSRETTKHFLLDCPLFHLERTAMLANLRTLDFVPSMHNLLYGSDTCNKATNCEAFLIIHNYLKDSGRFAPN